MKVSSIVKAVATVAIAGATLGVLAGCGGAKSIQIAVPSDPTNEARALLLLQEQGLIKLKDGVGLGATKNDIAENPHNIEIIETEAASLPRTLQDVDAAVINGNYAIGAGLDTASTLAKEDAASEAADRYANVVAVRSGEENSDKIVALTTALQSATAREYIEATYNGSVVSLSEPTTKINDAKAGDEVIKVGASPAPHAEILAQVKEILANHGYKLEVVEYSDYIQPNVALSGGELDANYFQHISYLEDYNANKNTDLVSAAKIHFEPLGLFPGKATSLDALKK